MTKKNKQIYLNRLKSFAWRTATWTRVALAW